MEAVRVVRSSFFLGLFLFPGLFLISAWISALVSEAWIATQVLDVERFNVPSYMELETMAQREGAEVSPWTRNVRKQVDAISITRWHAL